MEVNISEQGKWERVVEVTVPYEELLPKFNETYLTYKKSIQLEGFRKGKVPVDLIKKLFGLKIEKETAEKAVPDYLEEAVKKHQVKLYDISSIDTFEYTRENGLKFKATVKIEPEVVVDKFKELVVEKEIYRITDDDVNEAIENVREQQATMTNIDGPAQSGHYVVADIQQTDATGVPIIGQKFDNRYFLLGGEEVDKEFVDQLLGAKAGDIRQIVLHTPNPKSENEQHEYYSIAVKEVKEKKLPEIDDELAKDVGNFENLAALQKTIRENLERHTEHNTQHELDDRIIDEVIKNNPIELPDFMVENFLNSLLENMKKESREKLDETEIRERYRVDAIHNLKWRMIRDKISELEKIEVAESEINDFIETLAKQSGKNAPVIRSNYRNSKKRDQVRFQLLEKKVIDLLIKHAIVSDKVVTYQDRKKSPQLIV